MTYLRIMDLKPAKQWNWYLHSFTHAFIYKKNTIHRKIQIKYMWIHVGYTKVNYDLYNGMVFFFEIC